MSEVGMFDGRPIVLQRRFDAPIYAVWKVIFHDFWCQVAFVALLEEIAEIAEHAKGVTRAALLGVLYDV